MADLKISQLTAGTPTDTDIIPYVDLVAWETKKATKAELKGDQGDAATLDVGSTTTGAAWTDALVENSGTTSEAIFDFTIPRGDKGETGDAGETGATGADGADGADGQVQTIVGGTNITVDDTDPANPIVNTSATVNSSDATLLARANHTGTQTASTISDLDTAAITFSNKTLDDTNVIENWASIKQSNLIGDPDHIKDFQTIYNHWYSSGIMHGGDLTDNTDGTVDLSEGQGTLRATDDPHTTLYSIIIPEILNLEMTDNATNYISIDWNSGTPQYITSTSIASFNCLDVCLAYVVTRQGTDLSWVDAREQNVDANRKARRLFLDFSRFIHSEGGTAISEPSDLAIAITGGSFYFMMNQLPHLAFDTSIAGTANENVFSMYYRDGGTGWTEVADSKLIDTTTYDGDTGTPVTLANNKFGVTWFYIINNTPSLIVTVMGQEEYANQATAEAATPPSEVPTIVAGLGALAGFVVYEKSATAFNNVLSAFSQTFSASQVTTHNVLAGTQGGAPDELYHSTEAQNIVLQNTSGTNTGDQTSIVGITGTTAEFNTALSDDNFATLNGTEALSNKTISGGSLETCDINTNSTAIDLAITFRNLIDQTKKWVFSGAGITTSTTRTISIPDKDGTLAMLDDISWGTGVTIYDGVIAGEQATGIVFEVPAAGDFDVSQFKISLKTKPSGSDFVCRILINGVNQGNVTIATTASATNSLYITTDTSTYSVSENDRVTVEIAQIGSAVSGSGFAFQIS